jgi:hypothetical protein
MFVRLDFGGAKIVEGDFCLFVTVLVIIAISNASTIFSLAATVQKLWLSQ